MEGFWNRPWTCASQSFNHDSLAQVWTPIQGEWHDVGGMDRGIAGGIG